MKTLKYLLVVVFFLVGCSSNNGSPGQPLPETKETGVQAGTNTGAQAGTNTGAQAGTNTGAQAGTNTGAQAGTNTGAQAGTNTGAQAGTEESTSEEDHLQVYFTSDIERAEILMINVYYEIEDFKTLFKKIGILSTREREQAVLGDLNNSRPSKICQNTIAGQTQASSLEVKNLVCEAVKEITPLRHYQGVSCICEFVELSSGKIFYKHATNQ